MNQRLIQTFCHHLRQELILDTHFAAKIAAAVVVLFLLPVSFFHLSHLPLSDWFPFIVDLFAEGTMFFFSLWLLLNVIGLSRFLCGHTCLQALILFAKRVGDLAHIPAAYCLTLLNPETLHQLQISVFWRWLWQRQRVHPPDCWSKSQAPLLLFQQTPPLLAP